MPSHTKGWSRIQNVRNSASWGENPDLAYDCGNPQKGWLKKGVWAGFEKKWPCAFALIKNINFTNAQIAALSEADLSGADLQGARLAGADLTAAILNDADLRGVDLGQADLDGADLSGAKLP